MALFDKTHQNSLKGMTMNTSRKKYRRARLAGGLYVFVAAVMTSILFSMSFPASAQFSGLADKLKSAITGKPPAAAPAATGDVNVTIRSPSSIQEMFQKKTVNGEELMLELVALKTAGKASSASQLPALLGQFSEQTPAQGGGLNVGGFDINDLFSRGVDKVLSGNASYSEGPLGSFFEALTGNPQALREETIKLPTDTSGMTVNQQESVLVMAALVVAARVADKTLVAAKKDYEHLESDYAALLAQRQQIAALLADVLDKRRKALAARDNLAAQQMQQELDKYLSREDLAFIDSFGADRPLRDFAEDLGMQNLAIKFLQHSDPARYQDYQAKSAGLVNRTHAYLRTAAGVAAFGGFSVVFVQEIGKTVHDKSIAQAFRVLPFAGEFLSKALPLMTLSADTLYTGVILEPARAANRFRLARSGGAEVDVRGATEVFDAIQKSGDLQLFSDALYRDHTPGFVYHVYFCDRAEAGRIIDTTVPDQDRKQFAEDYLNLPSGSGFRFTKALADDEALPPTRLAEPLLGRDQRSIADSVKIGQVQTVSVAHYRDIKDDQLMRLILANSEGPYAQMQLGSTIVRLVPSMATVYAYENYADQCNKTANNEAKPIKAGDKTPVDTKGDAPPASSTKKAKTPADSSHAVTGN